MLYVFLLIFNCLNNLSMKKYYLLVVSCFAVTLCLGQKIDSIFNSPQNYVNQGLPYYTPPFNPNYQSISRLLKTDLENKKEILVEDATIVSRNQAISLNYIPNEKIFSEGLQLRGFSDLEQVSPENLFYYPVTSVVKIGMVFNDGSSGSCSGTLIGDRFILTAGHCLVNPKSKSKATAVFVAPAYFEGVNPAFGYTVTKNYYTWNAWNENNDYDYDLGVIVLDQPLGVKTGWLPYGYNDSNSLFSSSGNDFYNFGYPAEDPYDGETMHYWNGFFDKVTTNLLYQNKIGPGGMSGSSAYLKNSADTRVVYGVLSHTQYDNVNEVRSPPTAYTRINAEKFADIQNIIEKETPAGFELSCFGLTTKSSRIQPGSKLDTIRLVLYNSGKSDFSYDLPIKVYLSKDEKISASDILVGTFNFKNLNIPSKTYITVWMINGSTQSNIEPGNYYIGATITIDDANQVNNLTSESDLSKVVVEGTASQQLTLSATSLSFDANSGTKSISVSSNTSWSLAESLSWLSVSPVSGSNNGTVNISCTANTSTSSRTGTITVSGSGVADQTIIVTQTAGSTSLTVSQNSYTFNADGGSQSFSIRSNLSWTVSEFADWLSVNLTSGSNDGQVSISCIPNTQTTPRTGTVFVSGGSITLAISVTQMGVAPVLNVSPTSLTYTAANESKSFSITSNTTWTITESISWLSTSATSGSNNGSIAVVCEVNPSTSSRTGTITVSGTGVPAQSITITQAGSAPVVNVSPTVLNFNANGGSQTFNVSSNTNWSASESLDWLGLSITAGSNNLTVTATCSPNTSSNTRTGTITISGTTQTVSITQSGAAPAVCRAPSNLRNQITPDNPSNSISYSWFFVYWDAVPGATGYSARLRPVGSTSWREIKDVAVNQVDFRNLQPNTSFEVQVQSFCADGSASVWSSSFTTKTLGAGDPYCASYGDHQFGDINTVLLAGNALGGGFSQGYSFFKDKVYPLEKSRTYRLELVADDWQKSGEKPAYWRIWIDFNQDNDFNDPDELVFEAEGKNTGRVAGDLTLGANHSTGKTRMRIALDVDGQNGPCSTKGNRDVEDYLVEIRNPGDVWNEVVQTDQSHIIVLPQNLKSDIGGVALQENDQIGIFYIEKGVDYCAGKTKWTGKNLAITVYGDDLSTAQKDGFAIQEKFQLKVWQATSGNEYKITASYAPLGTYGIANAQGQYVSDGVSVVLSLGQNLPVATQEIPLQAGWNMVSAYLDPLAVPLDSILFAIRPSLQQFKNAAGKSFIFSPAINDIGAWNSSEGYRLKVSKPEILRLNGQMIDPSVAIVPIHSGWQIVPYYGRQAMDIETALNSIRDKIVIIKNNAGAVYIPGELAINTIGNLEPGQGYLLKASTDGQLRYPSSALNPGPIPILRTGMAIEHFKLASNHNTGQNSTLIFPKTVMEPLLFVGDEIGVFNLAGHLSGAGKYTGENLAITVWGDDVTENGRQGLFPGEPYRLRIWNQNLDKETSFEASFGSNQGLYREDDVVLVEGLRLKISSSVKETIQATAITLYPNPSTGSFHLLNRVALSGPVQIRVLNMNGQVLSQKQYPQGWMAGSVEPFNLSAYPNGVYQVQVRAELGWWNGKVSVLR